MANWSGGKLTAAGRALQAKVEAGTKLQLTKMKVGNGDETISDVDSMTDLKSPKMDIAISSTSIKNEICKVTGVISSAEVATGFYATELGLFAADPDAGEILYMIAIDPAPDYVPPSTTSVITTAEYSMNIAASNAESIIINVDPAGLATVDMVNKAACLLQRSTDYNAGEVLYDTQLRPGLYLYCVQAGKTGAAYLDLTGKVKGDIITDGTARWQIRAIALCWDYDSDGNVVML